MNYSFFLSFERLSPNRSAFLFFFSDLGNPAINGGSGLVLGRGPSPAIVDTPNLSLAANSLLNGGFQSLSSSTSPILSQGAGKIFMDHRIYISDELKLYICRRFKSRLYAQHARGGGKHGRQCNWF